MVYKSDSNWLGKRTSLWISIHAPTWGYKNVELLSPNRTISGCISFLFYIKPQQLEVCIVICLVVFPFFSTSNHNHFKFKLLWLFVVFPFFSTSNHNLERLGYRQYNVVFPFFSTSNHNRLWGGENTGTLYFLSFLHQTTTNGVS